jgi:23S rRNA (cytosine1962-C5)-methyltransferase
VYDASVQSVANGARTGDLGVIFDERRRFAAIGLLDLESPIRLRVLHAGQPTAIDHSFWRSRVSAARDRRAELLRSGDVTGYRLVNGESDGLPGVVVDIYGTVAVLKVYSASWLAHLNSFTAAVVEVIHPEAVILRLARHVAAAVEAGTGTGSDAATPAHSWRDGDALYGPAVVAPVSFLENGLAFEADVVNGQKTGHFLDQRDNRQLLRQLITEGCSVLDLFASTGGFTVYAAAGGAARVTSVDLSEPTLAMTTRNLQLNGGIPGVASCAVELVVDDAFAALERFAVQRRKFDVVVVDPPSFAQRSTSRDTALGAYRRLTGLAVRVVRLGGLLVQASCSSRVSAADFYRAVHAGAAQTGFELDEFRQTGHAIDHPADLPEAHYLKALFATVQRA